MSTRRLGLGVAVGIAALACGGSQPAPKAKSTPRCIADDVVSADWPLDPFCPEGTRLDPTRHRPERRVCYLVGSECTEHGPYEWVGPDGQVIEQGQHEQGLEAGTWTSHRIDGWEHRVTYLDGERRREAYARRSDGEVVLAGEVGPDGEAWRSDSRSVRWAPDERTDPSLAFDARRSPLETSFEDTLEILDVDPVHERVALRRIRRPRMSEVEFDCGYGGMQEDRYAGVDLGLWDAGEVTWFTIYALAGDRAHCTSEADASAALARAKARFAELGLDPTRRPEPVPVRADGERTTVAFSGGEVTLAVERPDADDPEDIEAMLLGASGGEEDAAVGRWDGIEHPPLWLRVSKSAAGSAHLSLIGGWDSDGARLVGWQAEHRPCCSSWGFVPAPR